MLNQLHISENESKATMEGLTAYQQELFGFLVRRMEIETATRKKLAASRNVFAAITKRKNEKLDHEAMVDIWEDETRYGAEEVDE